jgi:hypothetical protein
MSNVDQDGVIHADTTPPTCRRGSPPWFGASGTWMARLPSECIRSRRWRRLAASAASELVADRHERRVPPPYCAEPQQRLDVHHAAVTTRGVAAPHLDRQGVAGGVVGVSARAEA